VAAYKVSNVTRINYY